MYWNNIVNKHDYEIEILHDNITWEEAKDIERELIETIGRDNLCNLTDGGDGVCGWNPSEETRKEWSEQRKNKDYWTGRKHSDESKKIMREKQIGKPPSNKGQKMTPEQVEKLSKATIGRPSPRRKKVLCVNNGIIYESTEHAAKELELERTCVSKAASGVREHTKGFKFCYV
jgi:group I intron endonuclease